MASGVRRFCRRALSSLAQSRRTPSCKRWRRNSLGFEVTRLPLAALLAGAREFSGSRKARAGARARTNRRRSVLRSRGVDCVIRSAARSRHAAWPLDAKQRRRASKSERRPRARANHHPQRRKAALHTDRTRTSTTNALDARVAEYVRGCACRTHADRLSVALTRFRTVVREPRGSARCRRRVTRCTAT